MRKRPQYQERRNEILDAAWHLFAEKGYEDTTVQAIIDAAGISKGTFYHYFSAKEEVLDGVIERLTMHILSAIRPIIDDDTLSAAEKLRRFMDTSRRIKMSEMDSLRAIIEPLYSEENQMLRHRINQRTMELCAPVLAEIIREGNRDWSFNAADPEEAAAYLMYMGGLYAERVVPLFMQVGENPENLNLLEKRVAFFVDLYERILGAPKGSLHFMDREDLAAMFEAIRGR